MSKNAQFVDEAAETGRHAIPRVSIGVPVYNGQNYLREALDSLLAQTYGDFEILISDNASTDQTQAICKEYASRDDRIRYERQVTNLGAAANYNRVFEMARGEFFKWAAHDDVCLPTFLERCVEALDNAGEGTVLSYTAATTIDAKGQAIIPDPFAHGDFVEPRSSFAAIRVVHTLRTMSMVNAVFGVFRSHYLKRTRLIGPFVASDYVLMVELAMLGCFCRLDEPLLQRRAHEKGSRQANPTLAEVELWFRGSNVRRTTLFPKLKLPVEYVRSALRINIPMTTRLACAAVVIPAMMERKLRVTAGKWRQRILQRISSS